MSSRGIDRRKRVRRWNYIGALERHGTAAERNRRVMLGLELAQLHARRGRGMSRDEVASWCGVSIQAVANWENAALAKVRRGIEALAVCV